MEILVGGFAFLTIVTLGFWLAAGSEQPVDVRMRSLGLGRREGPGLASVPFQDRAVSPLVDAIGSRAMAVLPAAFVRRVERRLIVAGRPMSASTFYTVMVLAGAVVGGGYLALMLLATDGTPPVIALLPAVLFAFLGMYLASFWLSARAKARRKAMSRGLPDSIDLLTICVEAGLGLDAAFFRVTDKQHGPLVDELRQMLREVGLGKSRKEALLDFAERTDLEDVRTFCNSIIQAEELGTGVAQVLRAQSQRQRVRRRQLAEQEARRVPVKMVFPLVFCLMPSLFIFILGPIVVRLIDFLSDA